MAAHLNDEYNAITTAMDATVGHAHDGTQGGGARIALAETTGTLAIARGGTGATTADAALTAFGATVTGKALLKAADALAARTAINAMAADAVAPSATKLATARTINGVAFDGTANITIVDSTKLPTAGGSLSGNLDFNGNDADDIGRSYGRINALVYSATVTPNFGLANQHEVTLSGNIIIDNPAYLQPGQSGSITLVQDATGGRTAAFGSAWKFSGGRVPVLSTTPGAVDTIYYRVRTTTYIEAAFVKGYT